MDRNEAPFDNFESADSPGFAARKKAKIQKPAKTQKSWEVSRAARQNLTLQVV